ncbi:MAG TPA: hypothetical protein VGI25_05995 [Candidatus Udaeobacter sp.]|jgi:hypothetical protein
MNRVIHLVPNYFAKCAVVSAVLSGKRTGISPWQAIALRTAHATALRRYE